MAADGGGGRGGGGGGNGNVNGNIGRHDEIYDPEPFDPSADGEVVGKAELEQARTHDEPERAEGQAHQRSW